MGALRLSFGVHECRSGPLPVAGLPLGAWGSFVTYRIIGNDKQRALAWANGRFPETPHEPYWGPWCETLISDFNGEILAVVIYNNLNPDHYLDMHVVSDVGKRWATRKFLNVVFRYPFETLGLLRVNAKIGANNYLAARFLKHLGFTHEGTHPDGWDAGVSLLSFGLLKANCRYLGECYR